MREKFELNAKEKTQRKILIVLIICIVLIIAQGIFNQSNNINQDAILYPAFLSLSVIFCTIYSINAFTSGNLVKNWSSPLIFTSIFNQIRSKNLMSDEKAAKITTKIFGFFTLILAVICIICL